MKKVRKPRKPRESKQLNAKTLLNEVEEGELRNFVSSYLSLDQGFSIAFKTHFAHKLQLAEGYNLEKYYLLVRRFWRSGFSSRRGRQKIKQLEKYLAGLLGLADDLLATKEIQECFTILFGIQRFLISTNLDDPIIHEFEVKLVDQLEFLLRCEYAPSLRRKHLDQLLDMIGEYDYAIHDNRKNLYVVLHSLGEKPIRKKVIESLVQDQYEKRDLQRFLSLARIFVDSNKHKLLEDHARQVAHRVHFIEPLFAMLKTEYSSVRIVGLAETIYHEKRSRTIRNHLYQCVDSLAVKPSLKEPWHIRNFKKTQNPLALLRLHEGPPKQWERIRDEFITHFIKTENPEALAMIYVADGQYESLFSLLHKEQSGELILSYADQLPPKYHEQIKTLIEQVLVTYLDTHVGYPSAETTNSFLTRLNSTGLHSLTWPIMQTLHERYKQRKLLMSTLSEVST